MLLESIWNDNVDERVILESGSYYGRLMLKKNVTVFWIHYEGSTSMIAHMSLATLSL